MVDELHIFSVYICPRIESLIYRLTNDMPELSVFDIAVLWRT